ncbi:hypothetical protein D3C81_811880 [compost metagenome]
MGLDSHRQDARQSPQQGVGIVTAEGAAQAQRRHLARGHAQGLGTVARDFLDHFAQRRVIEHQLALAPGGQRRSVHRIRCGDLTLGIDLRTKTGSE